MILKAKNSMKDIFTNECEEIKISTLCSGDLGKDLVYQNLKRGIAETGTGVLFTSFKLTEKGGERVATLVTLL